jgi:hypothetical protein
VKGGRLGSGSGVKSGAPIGELGGVGIGGAEAFGVAATVAREGFGALVDGGAVSQAAMLAARSSSRAVARFGATATAQNIVQ